MPKIKLTPLERRVERNFRALKKQVEQRPPQIILGKKYFDETIGSLQEDVGDIRTKTDSIEKKINWMYEKIDWLYGQYQKHDTEHKLISGEISDHDDRIEDLEKKQRVVA